MEPSLELLHIETTTDCNLRCRHCARRRPGYQSANLTSAAFCKVVPAMDRYTPWINLSGHGETLCHPLFVPFFLLAADSAARGIEFQTNGLLLAPDLLDRLVQTGKLERVKVSIDGACDETHSWVRGVPLHRTLSNLEWFRHRDSSVKPFLTIECCAMRHNIAELPAVAEIAALYGAQRLVVGDLREYDGMEGQSLVSDWATAEPYYRAAMTVCEKSQVEFCPSELMQRRLDQTTIDPKTQNGHCRIPWTTAFVDVNGMVRPCCVVDNAVGNLNTQTFEEAWLGEEAAAFRAAFANGIVPDICKTCTWVAP